MSRVRVYLGCSLDGCIAGPDHDLGFLETYGPDAAEEVGAEALGFEAFLDEVGVLLMGRRTYQVLLDHDAWPYGDRPVLVATNRSLPAAPAGGDARAVAGPIEELLAEAKRVASGRDVYLDGGDLVRTLQGRCGSARRTSRLASGARSWMDQPSRTSPRMWESHAELGGGGAPPGTKGPGVGTVRHGRGVWLRVAGEHKQGSHAHSLRSWCRRPADQRRAGGTRRYLSDPTGPAGSGGARCQGMGGLHPRLASGWPGPSGRSLGGRKCGAPGGCGGALHPARRRHVQRTLLGCRRRVARRAVLCSPHPHARTDTLVPWHAGRSGSHPPPRGLPGPAAGRALPSMHRGRPPMDDRSPRRRPRHLGTPRPRRTGQGRPGVGSVARH